MTGRPLKTIPDVRIVDGWPLWLFPLRDLSTTTEGRRALLTVLGVLRCFATKPILDLESIETPYGGSYTICNRYEFHTVVKNRLFLERRDCLWTSYHQTSSGGPSGHALYGSLIELALLPTQLVDDIKLLGGEKLGLEIDAVLDNELVGEELARRAFLDDESISRKLSFRRLHYFSDKEGKTRVVASLDYWSQTALRNLHNELANFLAKLESDCTFNQGKFLRLLSYPGPYYSVDLSNATDRMPVWLQESLISVVIGAQRARAWRRILVS